MSEEIEYPSKERERAKVNVKVSAEVNTYLHDLYNQIQYEFCEQYEDEIKDLQQKVEQLESIRKEAIQWIDEHDYYSGSSDIYYFNDFTPSNDLLNILKETIVKNKRGV